MVLKKALNVRTPKSPSSNCCLEKAVEMRKKVKLSREESYKLKLDEPKIRLTMRHLKLFH